MEPMHPIFIVVGDFNFTPCITNIDSTIDTIKYTSTIDTIKYTSYEYYC